MGYPVLGWTATGLNHTGYRQLWGWADMEFGSALAI